MTHVRTSPYYPQSNGKIERWHRSLKQESIRPKTPLSLKDARRLVSDYVTHYNEVRLHSAIGYVPLWPNWKVGRNRFSKSVTASSKRREKNGRPNETTP